MTSQLYVDVITMVSPLTALLFGSPAVCYEKPSHGVSTLPADSVGLVQEGWLAVTAQEAVARCFQRLKAGLDLMVMEHVGAGGKLARGSRDAGREADPQERMELEEFVRAVAELLHLDQENRSQQRQRW